MRHIGNPRRGAVLVGAVALAVTASACGTGSSASSGSASGGAADALQQAFVSTVAKVRPEVVEIATASGLGSGVVWDRAGDIVTNAHVVGTATTFTVQLFDGRRLDATLVGRYVPDDLAVIRVSGASGLSPATFGNSAEVQVGDIVFAVGNPLGLSSSVTEGIVSYNGRSVSEGNGVVLASTIQTSAPINPGNSGGALVDLAGEVVGIPTLAAADQQSGAASAGIGFAVTANTVEQVVPQLIATGTVSHSGRAALGVTAGDSVDAAGKPAGAVVTQVTPGGAAAAAGISPGDVITGLAGSAVTSLASLQEALAQLAPGQRVRVDLVDQQGARRSVSAVLGELSG